MTTLTKTEKKSLDEALGHHDIEGMYIFGKEELSVADHEIVIQAMKANVSECVMKDVWDYEPWMNNNMFSNKNRSTGSGEKVEFKDEEGKDRSYSNWVAPEKMYTNEKGHIRKNYEGITDDIFECWFDHPIENDIRLTPKGECWENSPFNRGIVKFENMMNDETSKEWMLGFLENVDEAWNNDLLEAIEEGDLNEDAKFMEPYEAIEEAMRIYAENCFIAEQMGLEVPEVPEILFNDFYGETKEEFWEQYDYELSPKEKNSLLYYIGKQEK